MSDILATKAPLEEIPDVTLNTLSLHLSSFSYWGLTTHQTLKARETIHGMEVVVLVDPGAEANFPSTKLVSALGLSLLQLHPFCVEVGNGAIEQGVGGCEAVEVLVQGISIVANFFVMELGRSEVVLGAGWVASLGKFEGDYRNLSLSWLSNGTKVTLRGDPSLGRSPASGKMTLNALRDNEQGFLVTPPFTTDDFAAHPSFSQETLTLLQKFEDIFQTPCGLPPQRTHDHAIVLRENAEGVPKIRPYQYPHY